MSATKQKSKKNNSLDSDEDSEHELFHYANDRIRLMKEVLKLIKPKKIKSIAPDFMKSLDIDEINSVLLEELLGISNKRLKHILNADNVDAVSTSSDSEPEQEKPIDVISLDDISDTDDDFGLASVNSTYDKSSKNKAKEVISKMAKEIKKEKGEHSKKKETQIKEKPVNENDKLMNVLEILELQARARAIRSQLALEHMGKNTNIAENTGILEDDDDTAVIVSSPKKEEIVITSSDSEDDNYSKRQEKGNWESRVKLATERQEDNTHDLVSSENKNTISNDKNYSASVIIRDNTNNSSNIQQCEKLVNKDLNKKSIQSDVFINIENCDSSVSPDHVDKNCVNEDRNQVSYKSDSDNDVINLDSEDIEIK